MYGYPTVKNVMVSQNQPYLCVAHQTEKRWVQPLRLIAGLIAGPTVVAASQKIDGLQGKVVFATGLGMSLWSLSVYYYARKEMNSEPSQA